MNCDWFAHNDTFFGLALSVIDLLQNILFFKSSREAGVISMMHNSGTVEHPEKSCVLWGEFEAV